MMAMQTLVLKFLQDEYYEYQFQVNVTSSVKEICQVSPNAFSMLSPANRSPADV